MKKFNHAFTVSFSLENGLEDGQETPLKELIAGMARRLANLLEEDGNGAREAFECYDTYDVQEDKK